MPTYHQTPYYPLITGYNDQQNQIQLAQYQLDNLKMDIFRLINKKLFELSKAIEKDPKLTKAITKQIKNLNELHKLCTSIFTHTTNKQDVELLKDEVQKIIDISLSSQELLQEAENRLSKLESLSVPHPLANDIGLKNHKIGSKYR